MAEVTHTAVSRYNRWHEICHAIVKYARAQRCARGLQLPGNKGVDLPTDPPPVTRSVCSKGGRMGEAESRLG